MFKIAIDADVALHLLHESMAEDYLAIVEAHGSSLAQWLPWPPVCTTTDHFRAFIQRAMHDYADGKALLCAIYYRGQLVGTAGYNSLQANLAKGEIGYWVSPDFHRRGIAKRVVEALIKIGFGPLNLVQIELAAATENQPSRALAERLGFSLEGIRTRAELLHGEVIDHARYVLIRPNANG